MRIALTTPITVQTEAGDVLCVEAEVSVAVLNSAAIRITPIDAQGNEYSMDAVGVVGDATQEDIRAFMADLNDALVALLSVRGI